MWTKRPGGLSEDWGAAEGRCDGRTDTDLISTATSTGAGTVIGADAAPGSSRQQLESGDWAGAPPGQQSCDCCGAQAVPMSMPMPRHRKEPRSIAPVKIPAATFLPINMSIALNLQDATLLPEMGEQGKQVAPNRLIRAPLSNE